ncbi:zonadhesin [Perognathus longimembris pacificus]|uniref:zonadhesin n=1 Tax=Perognathus longimembris pacificus TaxID=214514 RepID=UPI002019DDE2|nr:zonadhesin [Perognathus longimembris pacificus]
MVLLSPTPRTQNPLDWEVFVRRAVDNAIITKCDFEDDSKPLCDWSQVSADDGDWIRTSGPSPTGISGPPGGYPNGEGYYLHMDSRTFRTGGVARLRSPDIWEHGPLCLYFAYHMFGLSWGAQLRLLLLMGTQDNRPKVLWKHVNTQSPSWMPTTVTLPAELILPSRLIFEGMRGNTPFLDISLDALSIHRGTCNRVCMMKMCTFDTLNDLCGWSWVPTATGAKWVQKNGSSGKTGVGPEDDFSSPGRGFYMLLDPKNAKPGQKSVLLSPLSQSDGCLTLSFNYVLWGHSLDAALLVYASLLGSIRKHTIFSGQPGPTWKPASVNYTGQGQIQFTVVGVFGIIPEPAVAVDAISIAPCGESFPNCNFEDSAHPFCDWTHVFSDGGHWAWGSKNLPTIVGGSADSTYGGEHYIYFEADKFSRAGQSVRLGSRPFCAPGDICVEFAYHMNGLGKGSMLKLLLGSPAGSSPITLWHRVGAQGPGWLNSSVTVPSGYQQPMQLFYEATRGSNSAFLIAVRFIKISHRICGVPLEVPIVPVERTTEMTTIPTEKPAVLTEKPTILTLMPTVPTKKPTILTEKPMVPTEKATVPTEKATVPTEKPMVPTEKATVPTEKATVPTEKPMVPTEKATVPTEKVTVPIEKPTIPTEKPTIPTEKPTVPTEKPTVLTIKPTLPTEKPIVPTEKPIVPTEKPTLPTEKPTLPTEKPTLHTQSTTVWTSGASRAPSTTRNATLTTVSCPPNAHYEPCMCLASCENPRPTCEPRCLPGCVCDQGFLLSQNNCISALSCPCFYSNRYYQPGEEWFNSNCSERCRCSSGDKIECQKAQCKTNTVCELRDHKFRCYPFGSATCVVYGALHYITFDERHIGFTGRCTYILTQTCHNRTTEPFFMVTAENEKRGVEGVSCLSKVYLALSKTSVTLLKGRRILVGGEQVNLPLMLSKDAYMILSGRFIVLQTTFGLTVRWDGDQQLYVTVTSSFAGRLCGLCGNYDGESSNDNLKPDGSQAQDAEDLGHSWQTDHNKRKECEKRNETVAVCDLKMASTLSGPAFCGQLKLPNGIFEACLARLKATSFFDNCMSDMCSFQGVQTMLCAHMSTLTAICQSAGLPVRPWRAPSFCPLACPPNSRYSLCAKPCPETCQAKFTQKPCPYSCVEACECDPGFILSGSQCVHRAQCGCITPSGRYLKTGDVWYKPECKELCMCTSNHKIRCRSWNCTAQESCRWRDGSYGCHALGTATCLASGDPHYLTFDGAIHHFSGTCNYVLSKPCWPGFHDNYFVVSATNENRGGNLDESYIKAVHVVVFDLRISLLKGYKVMVEGHQVSLPVWLIQDRVTIRFSGSFILFYTDFGLQVRYDGNHLVMVSVSSSYAGRLCGLCGNYNNNSLDDNLKPDKRPASSSSQFGASWRIAEFSDPGCFLAGSSPSSCQDNDSSSIWNKNCGILLNPMGPFSSCHLAVSPQISFTSCVQDQCESKGKALSLCNSLQAYADLCAQAGQAVAWRNSTFCPLKCLPNSSYKPCANPCPDACLSLSSPTYCPVLPCVEGCECQRGYILSGHSCVPPSNCGCQDLEGFYHLVGDSWYPEKTCHTLCSCSINNNITCVKAACQANQMCSSQDGIFHCQAIGTGVCYVSEDVRYMSFDGVGQPIFGTCTHTLVKVCDPSSKLPFFEISAKSESREGENKVFRIRRVYISIFNSRITLQKGHRVLIDGTLVTLPASRNHGIKITASGDYTLVSLKNGVQVKYGGDHFLEIKVPPAYHKKLCGVCGNFNGQHEDDLMMPNNELAEDGHDFMDSWQNHDLDPTCQNLEDEVSQMEVQETVNTKCQPADLGKTRQACQEALQTTAWAECATRVDVKPYILGCIDKLCEFGGLSHSLVQTLCEVLQGFEAACHNEGLKTPIWRNSSFCPLECPAHSLYSNCLPSCSPSCQELDCKGTEVRVPLTCMEGCICQSDYVLNEGQCVPRSYCGCRTAQGAIIAVNKTWISSGCTEKCACTEGRIQCSSFQCPYGSRCQHGENDSSYCAADKSEQCTILGDPYYRTFDRLGYHFPGRLTYILIKTVDILPEGIESLLVEGRNKLTKASSPTLHEMIIMVYGYKVQLQTNLELVVNDQKMGLPFMPNEQLQVTLRGTRIFLITSFQLIVSYDGKDLGVINLPSTYQGLVRGLCGNYDKDRTNDFMLPDGRVTQNIHVFVSSWTVNYQESLLRFPRALPEQEEGEGNESPAIRSRCSPEQLALIHTSQACRVLVDPQGPFAACHQIMDPEPFQEHCVFDMCASQDPKEQEELRCRALSGYAIICQEAGAGLAGWRNHTRCAMVCPANTVYNSCMTPCPASCANPAAARACKGPCLEGCASLPGYLYSGTRSLPKAHCGCTAAGVYYQLGDSFVTEDCAQHCTCASLGLLLCEPYGCRAGEICTLANFTRGCFQESPCLRNPCHNDGRCREQGATFTCECDPGYGGHLCTEPRDSLVPQKPEPSSFVAILLGMLVPLVVILTVLMAVATRECVHRMRQRSWWRWVLVGTEEGR